MGASEASSGKSVPRRGSTHPYPSLPGRGESADRAPRPKRLGERAFVEIVELAADRKTVRQLAEADRKSFQPLGEIMGRGLALQSRVHGQHDLVDAARRRRA